MAEEQGHNDHHQEDQKKVVMATMVVLGKLPTLTSSPR